MPNNQTYINGAAEFFGIPAGIYNSIIDVIGNSPTSIKSDGAYGAAGITPSIAAQFKGNRLDNNQNIIIGAKYLSTLYKTLGNWNDAAKTYLQNIGVNASNINFDFSGGSASQDSGKTSAPSNGNTSAAKVGGNIVAKTEQTKKVNAPSIWGFLTTSFPYTSILLALIAIILFYFSIQGLIKK